MADDILIYSDSEEEPENNLRNLLIRCRENGLKQGQDHVQNLRTKLPRQCCERQITETRHEESGSCSAYAKPHRRGSGAPSTHHGNTSRYISPATLYDHGTDTTTN